MQNTMRAAFYDQTGAAKDVLQVGSLEIPQPAHNEVLIKVEAHGVNPTDCKRRSGFRGALNYPRVIPGFDAAGVIVDVGIDVPSHHIGKRVWAWECAHKRWDGAASEYTVVPLTRAMPLADKDDFAHGASLGVPAMTAARAVRLGEISPDDLVIVTGGAGAVGNAAIVLAKMLGAQVLATARDDRRAEDAKKAGANWVISPDVQQIKTTVHDLTNGAGARLMVDVDLGAHLSDAWSFIAQNGKIASYGSASNPEPQLPWAPYMYRNISLHGVAIFEITEEEKLACASLVAKALEQGLFPRRIDSEFTLEQIASAHLRQEEGRPIGTIIVRP